MKMKLSTALSGLLLGSVLFTGCGSSSSSTPSTNTTTAGGTTTATTTTGAQFTSAMLGGKTFYNYFYNVKRDNNTDTITSTTYDDNMQFNFSADASTAEAISIQANDYGTNYGSALPVTLDKDLMDIAANGKHNPQFLIKELNGNLLVSETGDISIWTPTQGGAQTAYEALVADEKETVAMVTANPWYVLSVDYSNNDARVYKCENKMTIDSNGTITMEYIDNNGTTQTATDFASNVANAVDGIISDDTFVAATETAIYTNDRKILFKNKADVERYINAEYPGTAAGCMASYPN